MITDQDIIQQEVSCRVTNSVIKYIESQGGNVDLLFSGLPQLYTREYLSEPHNWVPHSISNTICQHAVAITGDSDVMIKVGLAIPKLAPLGGLETLLAKLTGPLMVYRLLPRYSRLFHTIFKFKTTIIGKNSAIVEMLSGAPGAIPTKYSCDLSQGILGAIPTLWDLPQAEIRKIQCTHGQEPGTTGVENPNSTGSCLYEVKWQPLLSWMDRLKDNILGKVIPATGNTLELERNLRYFDKKNAELVDKNKQLAIIRQIAIEIDKVRTIDEAMTLTVEQAGDIDGIRMIFVQRMDEARENVVTPYYSKLRPDTQKMVNAIKLLGIDLEKAMGDPNSDILRFPIDNTKVAQEYNRNPRVMIIPTLAELLDGTWPKLVCDGIQKIAGIKKCVIVPLTVGGESWGHMLFILHKNIPVDILEMIAGHCSQAIKNIIYLDNVEHKNSELSALNRIAYITSKSLDMGTLLNDALKEIIQIFTADAAAIYLAKGPSEPLQMACQYGIAKPMLDDLQIVPLDAVPMGRFFSSRENTMTGTMDLNTGIFPKHRDLLQDTGPIQFISSVLRFGLVRYGLINVTRNGTQPFNEKERSLLLSISVQLALSLENSRLHTDVIKRANEAEAARNNLEELFQKHALMENKLRESEERYHNIFESAVDILILFDVYGNIVECNSRIEDIAGYKPEALRGKELRALSLVLTPESLDILEANYHRRITGVKIPYYDVDMITAEGKRLIIQVSAEAVYKNGKIIGDLAVLRDVTEVKQAEKTLLTQKKLIDTVLATIPNAVLLLDKNHEVIMANEFLYKLFNLKEKDVLNKQPCNIPDFPCIRSTIEEALASQKDHTSTEIRFSIGGVEKILAINIFSMNSENLLVVISDVTEERKQQERLYLTDRLASVGEMASGVAHELNNPLTSIIGLSGLLKLQPMPPDVKEDLAAINSEAQRCAAIVKNLLTFARKHALKKEPVQVENVVKDVLKLRDFEHRANNISIETVFAPDMPYIMADYYQMQQVFLNIIINAESAMAEANKQGTLMIKTELVNGQVRISFKDDGPGITKETMGLIFNPFFTTKAVGKGTGLGLSIVYGIVTSHGGKVYANSEYGHGATFVVELPAIAMPSYVML
jgi:PAS domain S-box-containing protein